MEEKSSEKSSSSSSYLSVVSIVILVVFLGLVFFLYKWVNNKNKSQVVFPAGINYTGNQTQVAPPQKPQYDYAKLAASTDLTTFTSPKKQYTFLYPKGMMPLVFPGDVNDSSSFDVSNVPAQLNLMTLVETVGNYDPKMVGNPEQFVQNYWKYFTGLKGSSNFATYANAKGLKGYKINYITKGSVVTSDNYFFFMPDGNKVLHVNNIFPAEGQAVFTKILDSLAFK